MTTLTIGTGDNLHSCETRCFSKIFAYVTTILAHLCYRDIDELLVMGGVIWGSNAKDDYFVASHGVRTPDYFWKVIIRDTGQDERAIAWIISRAVIV